MESRYDSVGQPDERSSLRSYHSNRESVNGLGTEFQQGPFGYDAGAHHDPRSSLIISHSSGESINKLPRSQTYQGRQRYYQPTITRLPSLLSLLALTLGLIALLEYTVEQLPHYNSQGVLNTVANHTINEAKALISARAASFDVAGQTEYLPVGASTPIPSAKENGFSLTVNPLILAPSSTDFLSVGGSVTPSTPASSSVGRQNHQGGQVGQGGTSAAAGSAYLPVGKGSPSIPSVNQTPGGSAYLSANGGKPPSTIFTTATAAPSDYLPVHGSDPKSSPHTSKGGGTTPNFANPSAYEPVGGSKSKSSDGSDIVTAASAESTAYQPVGNPKSGKPKNGTPNSSDQATSSAASSNYVGLQTIGVTGPTMTVPTAITGAASPSMFMPVIGSDSMPSTTGYLPVTKAHSIGSFFLVSTVDGISFTVETGSIAIGGHSYATATPTTVNLGHGKTFSIDSNGNAVVNDAVIPVTAAQASHTITTKDYVLGGLLPTIIAVLFTIPWLILDATIKEMEPYFQLKQPGGASAEDSLCMNYASSITAVAAVKSMIKGHFTVFWSSIMALSVLLVAPLSSEAIFVGFIGHCTATSGRDVCSPILSVYPLAARIIQGILSFIAVLTLFLAISTSRRKSGVYANPLCIAGAATLMQNSHFLRLLRTLDPDMPNTKNLAGEFSGTRFRLSPYAESDGQGSYGITASGNPWSDGSAKEETRRFGGKNYASVEATRTGEESQPKHNRRRWWRSYFGRFPLFGLAIVVAGMLTLIVYYNRTGGNTAFERFMDSQSFGSRFLFTGIGVGIKLYWSSLDNESQRLEPYRSLVHEASPASTSLLLLTHTNPYTGLYHSLSNRHFSTAIISFLTILCDPLTIALSNIPFAPGIPLMTYRSSTYISIGILSLMLLAIAWMLLRAPMPRLIRSPDTVGSVMVFLCGSKMLSRFEGMSTMSTQQRERNVKSWGGRYMFFKFEGVDGQERWGVDEVGGGNGAVVHF